MKAKPVHRETTIHCTEKIAAPITLSWEENGLVDWAGGGSRYYLDGSHESAKVFQAYCFDYCCVSPSRKYAAICAKLHTSGQLMRDGRCLRQINRDTYFANAFEYPIEFARLPEGQEVLIHCPKSYSRLDIEDADSGICLTDVPDRKPQDFFHSRLNVSPGGKWLLSAGWVWHPLDMIQVYNMEEVLHDPHRLDSGYIAAPGNYEISSAAFVDETSMVVSIGDEDLGDEDDVEQDRLGPNSIALWRIGSDRYEQALKLNQPAGELMPISRRFVVSMYEHPKLIDLKVGAVIHEWKHINSGKQKSSIIWHQEKPPAMALDPVNARFAVFSDDVLHMVVIDRLSLG